MYKIIQGDALKVLKKMPSESVNMVMTSPPYWALRDYGVSGQLGLEVDFKEYILKLCDIFDEVKRVLKKDGSCFVNLGDTYSMTSVCGGNKEIKNRGSMGYSYFQRSKQPFERPKSKVPHKCLMQIPSRFSLEMIDRGWILRNKIIWHKPNAMPQSAKDRFTVDYEELFFFTKSRKYYFKQQFQPLSNSTKKDHRLFDKDFTEKRRQRNYPGVAQQGSGMLRPNKLGRNTRSVWSVSSQPFSDAHFAVYPEELCKVPISASCPKGGVVLDPFMGAGTTLKVALDLGNSGIGIELNPEYIEIAEKRIKKSYPHLPHRKV